MIHFRVKYDDNPWEQRKWRLEAVTTSGVVIFHENFALKEAALQAMRKEEKRYEKKQNKE